MAKSQEDSKLTNEGLPDLRRAERGLSLKGLLRSTPPYIRNKALDDDVVIKKYERKRTKGGMPAIVGAAVSMANRAPREVHRCSVIGYDKANPKLSTQKKVLVSCNCGNYTFTWEYANWTWGASKIVYSNGDPATTTNPANRPGTCKHLWALIKVIFEQKD